METIISVIGMVVGLIVTIVNIIFAGKVRSLTLQAEEKFKQSGKISDRALDSIQEINSCLRNTSDALIFEIMI